MYSFDIASNGEIYYQSMTFDAHLSKAMPDVSTENEYMQLLDSGWGANLAIEEDGGETFIGTGSYEVIHELMHPLYGHESQALVRVGYQSGKKFRPEELADRYFLPYAMNVYPAVDVEDDPLYRYPCR